MLIMGQSLSKDESLNLSLDCRKKILILGPHAAGKTSLLKRWQFGEVENVAPSVGMNHEVINWKGFNVAAWDFGGRSMMRLIARSYYSNSHGVVFVIDSTDKERFSEVKDEINTFSSDDKLTNIPVVVVANKQDLEGAVKSDELIVKLDLHNLLKMHSWEIVDTSVTRNEGVFEILECLSSMISKARMRSIGEGALGLSQTYDEEIGEEEAEDRSSQGAYVKTLSSVLGYKFIKERLKKMTNWF